MNISWRKISIVVGLLVLFGGAYAFSLMTKEKEEEIADAVVVVPPQSITVDTVYKQSEAPTVSIEGRLSSYNKIDIFAEVGGRLKSTSRPFKVGTRFEKGAVLLDIDKEEARLNLLAQKSSLVNAITQMMPDLKIDYPESFTQWSAYLNAFDLNQGIRAFPNPMNDQERYFVNNRNLYSQYYNIKSLENRLFKYVVTAPFSGVITSADITPGSLVRAGQRMGQLMELGNYELEATVSLDELKHLKIGQSVRLKSEVTEGAWKGKIRRISDIIDPASQSIIAYISVRDRGLREGMYLTGEIVGRTIDQVSKIDANHVVDGTHVFTVENQKLVKHDIDIEYAGSDYMLVKGLPERVIIPKERIIGAVEGKSVQIN